MGLDIKQMINDSEMILIGLGEEFDDVRSFNTEQINLRNEIRASENAWILPKYDSLVRTQNNSAVIEVLNRMADMIKEKNYYVITTSLNPDISAVDWSAERLVTPCGNSSMKQCIKGCAEGLKNLDDDDDKILDEYIHNYLGKQKEIDIGNCEKCGSKLVLNNVYAPLYDENGYLPQWEKYTRWLQGTLNRKLLVLELGVGMKFPSVIRFPFEKVAFYNNKASFVRVNEKLYHMSVELSDKGQSIAVNAIDWLDSMC